MSFLRSKLLLNKLVRFPRVRSQIIGRNYSKGHHALSIGTLGSKLKATGIGVGLAAGGGFIGWNLWNKSPFVLLAHSKEFDEVIKTKLGGLKVTLDEVTKEVSGEFEAECRGAGPVPGTGDDDVDLVEVEDHVLAGRGSSNDGDKVEFDWGQFGDVLMPYWKLLFVAVGSALVVAVINIEIPQLLGQVVDIVTTRLFCSAAAGTNVDGLYSREQDFEFLIRGPAVKLIGLYLLQSSCTFTYIYSLSIVGEGIATELRRRLFSSMLNQDIVFFDTHMTGEIVSRLTTDIQEFKSSFKQCVSQGLRSMSQAVGCIVSLYMISPEMTQSVVVIIPVIILIGSVFGRGLRSLSRKAQDQVSKSSGHAEETLSNIRTVRAFAMENEELDRFQKDVQLAQKLNVQLGAGIGLFQAGSSLFLNGVVLSVLYTGGKLISSHSITSGDLMSFLVAAQTIQRSLSNLSLLFGQFVRGIGAGGRVFQYINLGSQHSLAAANQPGGRLENVKGDVEFHNVWFRYPTRSGDYVLKRFSLRVPKGKVVAVVGASGSGKSTLVNLIEGFYPVEKGEITLDGYRIDMLDPDWVRGEVLGLINQEPVLFATSIMENIRYGKPEASDEEVFEAARNANAFNFIQEFPNGFQTLLGERGVTVSGGQKQRIAIARALIKNPTVLILDEATSALDTESEKIVQETLDSVSKGRTVLVIAHRLSTIQNADLIAVVSDGRVAELGTHTQLKRQKGLYHNLVKQQEYKAKTQKS